MVAEKMDKAPLYDRPSKSELKRRVEALQKAGEALIQLTPAQLEKMSLPDELHRAVLEGQKLSNKRVALKRQRQYIGRLMREIDAEPIVQAVNDLQTKHHAETSRFHEIEYWRDALLGVSEMDALTELIAAHPGVDVQLLRRHIAKAKRELQGGKGKRAQRELFAMLRGMIENA